MDKNSLEQYKEGLIAFIEELRKAVEKHNKGGTNGQT